MAAAELDPAAPAAEGCVGAAVGIETGEDNVRPPHCRILELDNGQEFSGESGGRGRRINRKGVLCGVCGIERAREPLRLYAGLVKGSIQRAVRVVADQGEVRDVVGVFRYR